MTLLFVFHTRHVLMFDFDLVRGNARCDVSSICSISCPIKRIIQYLHFSTRSMLHAKQRVVCMKRWAIGSESSSEPNGALKHRVFE